MSVTFSHTAEPIISGWVMECGCGEWRSAEFPSYEEVVGSRANGCTDEFCASYPAYPAPRYVGVEPLSANFSNVNARHLLSLLGIHDEDLCGSMGVDEFERALALAVPTEGKPSLVTVSVGGECVTVEGSVNDYSAVNFIDCGRDAGYDARAFATLREVVEQAKELHAEQVCWS
jgi:hypothetical protein